LLGGFSHYFIIYLVVGILYSILEADSESFGCVRSEWAFYDEPEFSGNLCFMISTMDLSDHLSAILDQTSNQSRSRSLIP
jgi:hypothetical protein